VCARQQLTKNTIKTDIKIINEICLAPRETVIKTATGVLLIAYTFKI
jgi:hypothetical protein